MTDTMIEVNGVLVYVSPKGIALDYMEEDFTQDKWPPLEGDAAPDFAAKRAHERQYIQTALNELLRRGYVPVAGDTIYIPCYADPRDPASEDWDSGLFVTVSDRLIFPPTGHREYISIQLALYASRSSLREDELARDRDALKRLNAPK